MLKVKHIIIYHRSNHHAKSSGYGRLTDYLSSEVLNYFASKFPYRLAKFLANFFDNKKGIYQSVSVIKDFELSKVVLFSSDKGIVHYLNGERDIRLSISLNKIKKRFKFIATFHKPVEVLENSYDPSVFKKLDGVIAVAENQVVFLKKWLNMKNVVYIPHGVDTIFFKPSLMAKESNTILFVGQHLRDFDAFNFILPRLKNKIPDLKVNAVLKKEFSKLIVPYYWLTIYNDIDDFDLREMYQKSAILLLPLKDSTACNSILEAMACGLPIVTTDVGGVRSYLNPECSILVPPNDNELLVNETVSLMADKERINKMSLNIRGKSLNYDWKLVAGEVNNFYNTLK